jgi:NTP pyrophosphatase (non-canonical NTP hydrolase)
MSKMTPNQYSSEAGATDERDYSKIQARMSDEFNSKLIHYLLGVGTEAGELQDALKKLVIYGKPIDRVNLIEEIGDVLWYLSRTLSLLDSSFEEAMSRNNAKLKARYGDKFTEHAALNRDLEKERDILEGKGE